MAAKNDNITKDPAAAAKKGAKTRQGKKRPYTLVKEQLSAQGVTWDDAEKIVEKNMLEFLTSENKKERIFATRYFSEFIKPKKREQSGTIGFTIEDYILMRKNHNSTIKSDNNPDKTDTNIKEEQ
jgi:hypothetical protein